MKHFTSATGKSRNHGLTHGYYVLVMFLVLGWFSSVWRIAAGVWRELGKPGQRSRKRSQSPLCEWRLCRPCSPFWVWIHGFQVQKAHNLECHWVINSAMKHFTSATGKSRNHGLTHGYYVLVMFLVLGWFSSVWRIAAGVSLIIERFRQTWPKEQKEIPEPAMQVEDMPSVQPVLGVNSRFSGSKGSQLRMSLSH